MTLFPETAVIVKSRKGYPMSYQPYLRPTATQQIRTFLAGEGEKIPPWAGFDEVMDHLWVTLHERRDDDEFWKGLEKLIGSLSGELLQDYRDALPDPAAETLPDDRICDLVLELREALKSSRKSPGPGVMKGFISGLRAPLAGCVILIGMALAAGCKVGTGEAKPAAGVEPTPYQYIDGSKLASPEKETLKSCVENMAETQQDNLVELFKTRSPDEIAAALEAMLKPGGECYSEQVKKEAAEAPAQDASADAAPQDTQTDEGQPDGGKKPKKPKKPKVPEPQALYKGVMF